MKNDIFGIFRRVNSPGGGAARDGLFNDVLKRQHSKKGNFVSSNAGVSERDLDIESMDFFKRYC